MRRKIFSFAFLAQKIRGNEAKFLFGLALITRLIALPFSQAMESDATSRLFLADHALHQGGELASLQWPSLHIYFLSLAQFISRDILWGPVILSLLMGAFAVVPFYLFTKNIYSQKGAFYTALIFTFSPLIFRLSFVPLSEIYHVCFCITALWCLSEGLIRKDKKWKWGMLAGLAATIAAGGRFEAWVLIGLLGIILIVLKEWKMMFAFGLTAAIFPVWWLIYCYRMTGHPLISLEMVEWQNFVVGKVNENMTEIERFRRVIYFPFEWLISVTPIVAIMSVWFFVRAIVKRKITRLQFTFGCLFYFFLPFFVYESITGSLADQARYTVTLIMLSLPSFALWFENSGKEKFKNSFAVIIAVLLIPWSYAWQRLPWHKVFFASEIKQEVVAEIVATNFWQSEAIPSFHRPGITTIVNAANKHTIAGDGYFIDFSGWCESYYFAQQSDLHNSHINILSPVAPHNGDEGRMKIFFEQHPRGTILLSDFSDLSREQTLHGPLLEFKGVEGALLLSPIMTDKHIRLFRYFYLPENETAVQRIKYKDTPPLFSAEKDLDYYITANYSDAGWIAETW
ncbi:MAG: glycosyltransferase family 39 protein, partial [Bacteroidota bacterium]|nr:glycosyltransferase family 39 protein [Bacteroidota bacterium]